LWARMGPRNHVLDVDPDSPWEGAILGKGAPIAKYRDTVCDHLCENGWIDRHAVWTV